MNTAVEDFDKFFQDTTHGSALSECLPPSLPEVKNKANIKAGKKEGKSMKRPAAEADTDDEEGPMDSEDQAFHKEFMKLLRMVPATLSRLLAIKIKMVPSGSNRSVGRMVFADVKKQYEAGLVLQKDATHAQAMGIVMKTHRGLLKKMARWIEAAAETVRHAKPFVPAPKARAK